MTAATFLYLALEELSTRTPPAASVPEPGPVAGLSLIELASLLGRLAGRDPSLRDPATLELAIRHAAERFSLEDYTRVLSPFAPERFDLRRELDAALHARVVHHPVHGIGFPMFDPPADAWGDWSVRVLFADAERTFVGADAVWTHPRVLFVGEAVGVLSARVGEAPDERFWSITGELGWGRRSIKPEALGRALAGWVGFLECVALDRTRLSLGRKLRDGIEAWEKSSGMPLPCGDDSFGDLVHHVIGLGRETYEATLADPALALSRAETRDYEESFAYVFQVAERHYPLTEVLEALRQHGGERVVEDPALGLGIRMADGSVAFPDCVRGCGRAPDAVTACWPVRRVTA